MGAFREFLNKQQIDELSRKTLTSYVQKSKARANYHAEAGKRVAPGPLARHAISYHASYLKKRNKGVKRAAAKLKKLNKPGRKIAKKKGYDYSKHGVADIATHVVSSGIKKGISAVTKGIVKKVLK